MTNYLTIEVEKYDEEIKVPYDPDMTLETFKEMLEKALCSPCKLNITQYEKKKKQKMKDVVNNNTNIFLLNNEHLGSFIKNWKGNFNNLVNDCFKNSFSQSFIHSVVKSLVDKEEAQRKKKGFQQQKILKIIILIQKKMIFMVISWDFLIQLKKK